MRIIVLLTLLSVIASCSQKQLNSEQCDEITNEVKHMLNAYQQAINKEGLLAEFRYLDTTDQFYWVPPGYTAAISFDSVSKILNTNAPYLVTINNRWEQLKITPHTASLANYTGILRSTTTNKQARMTDIRLIETGTVIKRPGGWKLLCGQTAVINY